MADKDRYARFRRDTPIVVDGVHTYGRWNQPSWLLDRPEDKDIRTYKVASGLDGRPDLISNEVYGTPELYWVLIAFNRVQQPFGWPRVGDTIEYPDDSLVVPEL